MYARIAIIVQYSKIGLRDAGFEVDVYLDPE
jgi:hypothetical protein